MYVSVLFSVSINLSIIFLFDKKQCSVKCECWHHTSGWPAIQTTENWGTRYGYVVVFLCTVPLKQCTTTTSARTIPLDSCTLCSVLHAYMYERDRIPWESNDRRRCRTESKLAQILHACITTYQLFYMHSDPNSPEGFPVFSPCLSFSTGPANCELTTLKEFRGMWYVITPGSLVRILTAGQSSLWPLLVM